MVMEITYALYLVMGVAVTVWVARSLRQNGRVFLMDGFGGRAELADAASRLLVIGFYLINIGYVTLALRYGNQPTDTKEVIEYLSSKIGLVLLMVGGMHFFNVYVIARLRKHLHQRSGETSSAGQAAEAADRPAGNP